MKYIYSIILLISYGSYIYSQNPCPGTPTVDYAGKTYHTVQIGSQCWLKENINVGIMIIGSQNQKNNKKIEKYCYNNDPANCALYGGLYQWAEAVQYKNRATNTRSPNPAFTGNTQGICPQGWHLPTNAEFTTLATTVNNDGNALKAVGQEKDSAGTNTSGFSALLSGSCYSSESFSFEMGTLLAFGHNTDFWSSTEYSELPAVGADYMSLGSAGSGIQQSSYGKVAGFSVRCLKDN